MLKPATQFVSLLVHVFFTFLSCSSDDDNVEMLASVTVNGSLLVDDVSDFDGDIDASFTGSGGSATRTFTWRNNLNTADYNADITASSEGSFRMIVEDAEANVVLDRTIQGGGEPDSIDGVTASGVSGIWTVSIIITNFNGDGSFSLSEGN